ncbi:ATP-binding protein [Marinitenerispora sediminis]|uniref:ATP-binding protein n=1 Tax=Marinitenerispora sediminis TaxID=1931232 RepID=UPI001F15BC3B|nr:ATP-binding protein [Marinitenerispora sediminis]
MRWEPRLYPGLLNRTSRVRADIRTDLKGFPDDLVDDIELAASELHANAVRYTASGEPGGEVTRRLSLPAPGRVRLEVTDGGWAETRPRVPDRDSTHWVEAEGQRGLLLISALAVEWGYYQVLPHPWLNLGLGVWADFAVAPEAVPPGLDQFVFTS